MGKRKPKVATEAEIAAAIRAEAFEVFAAGAWYESVDDLVCPDQAQLFLNATVGVARLLFILADEKDVAPEVLLQAFGFAAGDRTRPQDASFHEHAKAVLLEGYRQGVTGDTIGQTVGAA